MNTARLTRRVTLVPWCALLAVLAGCGAKDSTAPKTTGERVNADKPSANNRIVVQSLVGDATKSTTIQVLRPAADGSLGLICIYNGVSSFGALGSGGSLRWMQAVTTPNQVRALESVPATAAVVANGWIVAGARDVDRNGQEESGFASLYSSTGNLITQLAVTSDSSHVWINGVARVDDSTFVACGGVDQSGNLHPYLVVLQVRLPAHLELVAPITVPSLDGWFSKIVLLPSSSSELLFAATSSDGTTRRIHGLRAAWPAFGPITVDWTQAIVPPVGTVNGLFDLAQSGGDLYVAGAVSDPRKSPPSGGGSWSSGFATSFTGAGLPKWSKVVSLTQHSEHLYSIAVGPDAVYAAGAAGGYVFTTDPKDNFGYGWVTKLDLATGTPLADFTFGDEKNSSGFDGATWTPGGLLVCGGWTQYELDGGPHPGWLATVDASGTGLTHELPAAAAVVREATREDPAFPPPVERRRR